jgi:hypothetical protein
VWLTGPPRAIKICTSVQLPLNMLLHAQVLKEAADTSPAGTVLAPVTSSKPAAATPLPLRLSPAGSPTQVQQEAGRTPHALVPMRPLLVSVPCATCRRRISHVPGVRLQADAAQDRPAELAAKAILKEREQQEKLARKVHLSMHRCCRPRDDVHQIFR